MKIRILTTIILTFHITATMAISADEIVYETTQEVLNQLDLNKERLKQEPEYIQTIVRDLIVPHMDFATMSAITLGSTWKELNTDEQNCFADSFKNLLIERYAYILLSYRNQNIHYQSAKPIGEKGYVSMKQTLTRPEVKPLTLEYPMRPDNNSWKVVDLVVDGVSLLRNYRKMYDKEIKDSGLPAFIKAHQNCK